MIKDKNVVIGIDVGGSTTKIVGFRGEGTKRELIEPFFVQGSDPVTSAYGAFGKFLDENSVSLSEVETVKMTGVGSAYLKRDLYGLPCVGVPEFTGIGLGGLYLSGLDDCLVVSLGTGTAIVHATRGGNLTYLGGTGVGGGTLLGLSRLLLKVDTVEHLVELAADGDLSKIDLRISDLTKKDAKHTMPAELTAANFGNVSDMASKGDIAKGVMNMVYETVAMCAVFAARSVGVRDIVLTGNLTCLPFCAAKFDDINAMYRDTHFLIPDRASYATVIGTALYTGA